MKTIRYMAVAGAVLLLAGCVYDKGYSVLNVTNPEIKLKISGNPPKLSIDEDANPNCNFSSQKKGCFEVAEREIALVPFRLLQANHWDLTKVKICTGNEKGASCELDDDEQLEFWLLAGGKLLHPDENGIVDFKAQLSGIEVDKFFILDINTIEQDYFYSIQACKDGSTSDCVWTDPGIRNRGR